MNRRLFLQSSSSVIASGILTGFPDFLKAFAQQPVAADGLPHFFVMIVAGNGDGGMDVIQGLDPWFTPTRKVKLDEADLFVDYLESDILQSNGIFLGPSAKALIPYMDQSLVINGVVVSENDNGHSAALAYMTSGSGNATRPDYSAEIATLQPKNVIGLISNRSAYLYDRNLSISNSQDIINSIDSEDLVSVISEQIQTQTGSAFYDSQKVLIENAALFSNTKDFLKKLRIGNVTLRPEHAIAAGFASGLTRTGMIEIQVGSGLILDSHQDYAKNHHLAQTTMWDQVAAIYKFFKETPLPGTSINLFDRTTFMVVSEFSRTPALNKANGKDHNPNTNSVLVSGYGVKKSAVIGASSLHTRELRKLNDSLHIGAPIDVKTNEIIFERDRGGQFIRPENVLKTVGVIAGIEKAKLDQSMPDIWNLNVDQAFGA